MLQEWAVYMGYVFCLCHARRIFHRYLCLNQAGLALGDLKSVKDLYDFKTLSVLFLIGLLLLLPTLLKRKRIYE